MDNLSNLLYCIANVHLPSSSTFELSWDLQGCHDADLSNATEFSYHLFAASQTTMVEQRTVIFLKLHRGFSQYNHHCVAAVGLYCRQRCEDVVEYVPRVMDGGFFLNVLASKRSSMLLLVFVVYCTHTLTPSYLMSKYCRKITW